MSDAPKSSNFIRDAVIEDLQTGRFKGVVTRFPPEPNGYLHIGHAQAVSIDFGAAREFGGRCHPRVDDTNPAKESPEDVGAVMRDLRWLRLGRGDHLYHASDSFEPPYEWGVHLIKAGQAHAGQL